MKNYFNSPFKGELLSEQVLGPLLYRRAGKDQRGVRRLETLRLDEERRLATTIALHDALSVRDAIKASASIYLDLRADDPSLEPTTHMPGLLYDLIERAVPGTPNRQ